MSLMLSYMAFLKRMSMCNNHLVMWILLILPMCASFINLCMVSNKLLEPGLTTLSSFFFLLAPSSIFYLYVDDIIVIGNNPSQISSLITALSQVFKLKYLGPLSYFLGIQISHTKYGITLTQTKYAYDILHRFNMTNSKPVKTPCYPSSHLVLHSGVALSDPSMYRSLVGALQYLTFTRLDLA